MVAHGPAQGRTKPTAWWHKVHRVVAQSPPRGGTTPIKWWHTVHRVVAQSPPRGHTKPTKWWHKVHRVVAQSPPSGGTKPTKWWNQVARHEHVVRGLQRAARQRAGKKHSAWRGPWVRGLSSARRRPPANRRGVRLPRRAYIVRSRYTYTYTHHMLWARACGCGDPTLSPWPACPLGAACRGGSRGRSPGGPGLLLL